MELLTVQEAARRTGLTGPTLRYYEEIGLIGPVVRDASSGHRRYSDEHLEELGILACMRELGVGIEDMRIYQANRAKGHSAAIEQRDLMLRHAERIEAEIAAHEARLGYVREKAALWDARARGDEREEARARERVLAAYDRLELPR